MGPNPKSPAYDAGLRQNEVITAVNDNTANLGGRAFLVWFVQNFDAGDSVTLTVAGFCGAQRKLSYKLPARGQ